ncbi:MAG TPA: PDZ domain-containing protein, partial [Kofleriaceae bacterium]
DGDGSAVGRVRWSSHDRPRLTDPEGKFVLDQLAPGTYTILAYRKGGGEAIAEHVALGKHVQLAIRATGSIEGTVTLANATLDELAITLTTRDGFRRTDAFYRTSGRYTLRDVAPGTYQLRATTPNGTGELAVAIAPDEHKTGVDLALEPLATLTGTLVDLRAGTPLANLAVFSFPRDTATLVTPDGAAAGSHISDASGRFTVRGSRTGPALLLIRARTADAWSVVVPRTLPAQPSIDLGSIPIVAPRVREGDPVGRLGITFGRDDSWWPSPEIVAIDPAGPAAASGLRPTDILTSIDNVALAGPGIAHLAPLLRAPPGTKLRLEVRRGVVAEIVLAPPL